MLIFENKNLIDDLITGFLKNELSHGQIKELTDWVNQSPEHQRYFDECREIWLTAKSTDKTTPYHPHHAYKKFLDRVDEQTPVFVLPARRWLRYAGIAAVFIFAFFLGGLVFHNFSNHPFSEDRFSEIVVPRGSKAGFTLPDGTHVTLNAGSRLRYRNSYGLENRVVELEGEGYFKVFKDKSRPFIVTAGKMTVEALGTEFNVKAYPADKTIETTLVEGTVKIAGFDVQGAQEIILKPNQKLTFFKNGPINSVTPENKNSEENVKAVPPKIEPLCQLVKENVKVEPYISWKENRWIIEKEDLSKLATDLERRFDIQIYFESERLKSFRFTGTLLDEPLEQVLRVVSITAPINYEIDGKKVTLSENEDFERIYRKLYQENSN